MNLERRRTFFVPFAGTVAVLIILMLAACSNVPGISKKVRSSDFNKAIETHAKLMRWGYYDEAAAYLRTQDGSLIDPELARIARYRISSYEVISQLVADTGREGRVVILVEYYEIDSGRLDKLRYEQFWWHDTETDRWFLGSPLPPFGRSGPG